MSFICLSFSIKDLKQEVSILMTHPAYSLTREKIILLEQVREQWAISHFVILLCENSKTNKIVY